MKEMISTDKKWYAVKTRFKAEKKTLAELESLGIEAYLPLVSQVKRYTRKVKRYQIPLIYGYLFVRIDRAQYVPVLERPNVIGFVKPGGAVVPVPEDEIDILKRVCGEENADVRAEEIGFIPGAEVELVYGNLSGLKGKMIQDRGGDEFVVQLQCIGYQLRIVVGKHMLMRAARTG